jgi:hypothetical protein
VPLYSSVPDTIQDNPKDCTEAYSLGGRFSVVVGILAYYARGRGFDSRTVHTSVCMKCLFLLGLGVSMYKMFVFTKKNVYKYVFIRYLESIIQAF